MEYIPKNDILEFRPDQLNLVRKQYNFEKPGDMDRAIDVLEMWIKMQKHFVRKQFPRDYLEKNIIANKGSLERVKMKLDKICTYRTAMPDFFQKNLTMEKFDDIDVFVNVLLPKPTKEFYRVYLLKNTGKSFTASQILNYYRYVVLICEYILAYDYSDGFVIVVDYTETNLVEFIKSLNLTELRQVIAIVTEGFVMRLKGIHMITSSKAIEALVVIMKQLLSAKLGDRIHVHNDLDSLYKILPQDMFPSEYGGKEKPLLELRDDLMNAVTGKEFMNYVNEMTDAKTDEALRQTDKFNEQYMGMPGSFRTLNVD